MQWSILSHPRNQQNRFYRPQMCGCLGKPAIPFSSITTTTAVAAMVTTTIIPTAVSVLISHSNLWWRAIRRQWKLFLLYPVQPKLLMQVTTILTAMRTMFNSFYLTMMTNNIFLLHKLYTNNMKYLNKKRMRK